MASAVVVTPASGSITHLSTAVEVTCTGAASNTATGYDTTKYPTEPALDRYFKAALAGQPTLKSPVFNTNAAEVAEWHDVIFPAAGSWTVTLNFASDDSVDATATVVVS
ncbi:MAG TPA: hypothetical protein VIU37_13990 [Candidatus Limnocylindrales bacterium]